MLYLFSIFFTSTVSSAINSYAITIVEDFIRPRWPSLENEKKKITVVKITSMYNIADSVEFIYSFCSL